MRSRRCRPGATSSTPRTRPSASAKSVVDARFGQDRDAGRLHGLAQPVDQFGARAARQAVHAAGGMAGIGEVVDDGEGQAVSRRPAIRPSGPIASATRSTMRRVGLAVRLALDVRRRSCRRRRRCPGLAGSGWPRQGSARPRARSSRAAPRSRSRTTHSAPASCAASAAQSPAAPPPTMSTGTTVSNAMPCAGSDAAHAASTSAMASATVAIAADRRSAPRWRCRAVAGVKAAQPSLSTIVSKSRTCASRTVEATPPLVTMPAT